MRKIHQLSDETIKVLNGSSTKVADEYGCQPQYIRAVLAGTETDPFAKFVSLYSAAVRAGCDVSHWLNRLDGIKSRYLLSDAKCVRTETLGVVREANDVPLAAVGDKPLYQQLSEATQARDAVNRLIASLNHELNLEEDEGGSSRFDPRQFAKQAVNGRAK